MKTYDFSHLAWPDLGPIGDVREGVRATRLAARIGDIANGCGREHEKRMALARRDSRWEDHFKLLMFSDKAEEIRQSRSPENGKNCTMGYTLFKDDVKGDKKGYK